MRCKRYEGLCVRDRDTGRVQRMYVWHGRFTCQVMNAQYEH